jgi:sister chromatid cohesion protein DCC1
MSSQDNQGIALNHGPDGAGYKLIELPPELQSLLEAEDAPR